MKKNGQSQSPIAIEINFQLYAPIQDIQGSIIKLIDARQNIDQTSYSAFGELQSSPISPWGYATKRLDPDTGLIHFGKRDYSPTLDKWLTPDPAGFTDSINLYQYVLNNPFRYCDPDGQFAIFIPLIHWTLPVIIKVLCEAVVAGAIFWGICENEQTFNDWINKTSADTLEDKETEKKTSDDVYAPDRELPRDKHGVPIPETDAPHTQLGTKKGSKGTYPQSREFDEHGKPVHDIDFTDHCRPDKHPNPHQHQHIETKQLLACKSRGSLGVDLKSTIILNRFPFLFINI